MTFKTLDAVNTSQGLHTVFIYVNELTLGLFSRLFLLSFFLIIGLGAYLSQQRLKGKGDLAASMTIAGFVTSGAAIIMSFLPGLINTFDIVVIITATIMFALWLFMSKRNE